MRHVLLPAALLALLPASLAAQPRHVDVTASAGYYNPIQSLPSYRVGTETHGAVLKPGFVLNLAAERPVSRSVALRASWLHAHVELTTGNRADDLRTSDARLDALVGDVVLRTRRVAVVHPYLLLGGGVKHYGFDTEGLDDDAEDAFEDGRWSATAHLGAGVELDVYPIRLVLEASHYGSAYEPIEDDDIRAAWQNDLVYTVGVRIRAF
ncbi:MAG TPA: hypothetical protein VFQ45_02750 [Longimicrobium sp.]|nr:hypothetical protein [Longimicrobium sp.]